MRNKIPILTGMRSKFLTIFERSYLYDNSKQKRIYYICKCECGNLICVDQRSLFYKKTTSCGCRGSKTIEERKKIGNKTCCLCKENRSLKYFYVNNRNSDALDNLCQLCSKLKRKKLNYKLLYQKQKERYKKDPSLKLRKYLGSHICHSLQSKTITKSGKSWISLLGYTPIDLKNYLSSKLQPGMTWDNYGKIWHVDHIIPSSWWVFNSPSDPEFRQCWCLANLQPKFARENISKRNYYVG